MKHFDCRRLIALALCLLLTCGPGLAEGLEIDSEAPVSELPVIYGEQAPFELAGPEPANNADAAEPEEQEAPEYARTPFVQTVDVSDDTWRDMDLVRADGFKKAFANVTGLLTLDNVLIGGKPARRANLFKAFSTRYSGRIAILDDAPMSLDLSAMSLDLGQSHRLSVAWKGKHIPAWRIAWKSSNPAVAAVNKSGKVTALKKGKARITAEFKGERLTCYVRAVRVIQPESIALAEKRVALSLNRTAAVQVSFTPANTTFQTVTWTSSDPAVVSVDADGRFVGKGVGRATLTASTVNGKTASCEVTVTEVALKGVGFSKLYMTMNPGKTRRAKAVPIPEDSSYTEFVYKSSDDSVARVDRVSGEVTAVACGTATLTAVSTRDPGIRNTCKVCVIDKDAKQMEGLIIGINPGHQIKTIFTLYPIAPGSGQRAYGCKTGACGKWTRVPEYETVLQIGLKLRKLCEDAGAKVVITRTTNDVSLTNIERATMLNEAGVDVALQLHCNSVNNSGANGNSGYIRTTGDWVEESREFSRLITAAISQSCGCVNLGVLVYNGYMSLNWTTTPSVLLEMGYISNYNEDKLLATDEYRQKMAQGIFNGLCEYFER